MLSTAGRPHHTSYNLCGGVTGRALDLWLTGRGFKSYSGQKLHNNLWQVVHTYVPLSPSSITWYRPRSSNALQLGGWRQAWWKVMAAYHRVDDIITCELTACTPGSAPGPTLSNEYEKPLPLHTSYTFSKGNAGAGKSKLHTQQEPHEPWSRISLIVGQFGQWVRASKESGREAGSILWLLTGSKIWFTRFTTPQSLLTCSSETFSKFTPACNQWQHNRKRHLVSNWILIQKSPEEKQVQSCVAWWLSGRALDLRFTGRGFNSRPVAFM